MILLVEKVVRDDVKISILEAGDRHNQGKRSDLHYVHCGKNGHEENTCIIPWEKIK